MQLLRLMLLLLALVGSSELWAKPIVTPGIEVLMSEQGGLLKGKKIGLITNHTGITATGLSTIRLLKERQKSGGYTLKALFGPEHGITGSAYAAQSVKNETDADGIPIYSLHGATRRPTDAMLKGIDTLIFDVQDIGSRSYTYISTLCYVMEEAAKHKITVIVADRPNPINGLVVDGPMLDEKSRSFVGYLNVPYCHGMTVGELANFFNQEYKVGCDLHVISMKGWKRSMTFLDTGLPWIPTSPQIPEADTPLFYPITGIIGELSLVSTGVGYTLPFKTIGAPWIDGQTLADNLNKQQLPGVTFHPIQYCPFFGRFKGEECNGVLINVTDPKVYKPVSTQYMILGVLKSLYPEKFKAALKQAATKVSLFSKVNGTDQVWTIMNKENFIAWPLIQLHHDRRSDFVKLREKYLIKCYDR